MSMPPEIRRALQATLDAEQKQADEMGHIRQRLIAGFVDKGLSLSPDGVHAAIACVGAVAKFSHDCTHDLCERADPEAALEIFDEFVAKWVLQRMAEDPKVLKKVKAAVLPDTARLFAEPEEVNIRHYGVSPEVMGATKNTNQATVGVSEEILRRHQQGRKKST